ncbi:Cyclin-dependent kinase 11B [Stylophora pistillata]|uniref:cyclin-dependent kinase n=1 Tax=Stylophora pistillata TaxID=50429 RepID=A0A2B4RV70_STYPI|nr:Cyclin-dependent kinase 11B [Stylophora pistillata]
MDNSFTFANRRRRERGLGSKNGSKDAKLDFHKKRAACDFPHDPCWEASIQDLPLTDEQCAHQSSKESSDEEWSDFSFYDFPETLKVGEDSFHRPVHPAEHMIPTHMVSRPPYHATAKGEQKHFESKVPCPTKEQNTMSPTRALTQTTQSRVEHTNHEVTMPSTAKAHRVHTLLDTEVSNPFSITMEDSANQSLSQGTASQNSNQTTQSTTTSGNSTTTACQDVIPSNKAFDGSLFYRHSDLVLSGKHRKETRSEKLQQNGGLAVSTSNASSLLSQASMKGHPAIRVVPSEVSVHKRFKTGQSGHGGVDKSENASYLGRLKKSFPSNRNITAGSSSQEILANKFMQRSREVLHRREKQKDVPGSTFKKEHSSKSVSFANSVKGIEKQSKTSSSGKEEVKGHLRNSRPKEGHAQNGFSDQREHTVQSNVVLSGRLGYSFSGSGSQNSAVKESFDQEPREEITMADGNGLSKEDGKHGDSYDIALPPSPPTRDTNQTQRSSHSVQLLSMYGEQSLFESNLSRNLASPPRQSNVSLGFSGSKTLSGASLRSSGKSFIQQTNSKVVLSSRPYLMSGELSRDNSLTIEELLSSGSVKSSPENSPPSKFTPQFEKSSKREHSLDDYLDKSGNLLQDLSMRNSFPVDTSQRISSALWASRTSSPNSYQELLLKGRLFRRWYQKTRLKRLIKQEDDVKLQSAVTFWQTETQHKFFEAWRNARTVQLEKADKLRRKLMLQKGLTALRFAVSQHKQSVSEWQKSVQMKETVRLREAFDKWHLFKMDQYRGAMMEQMADRHLLSRNYIKWKIKCDLEQKNGVASLHYKVHYEEHLQARLFTVWKENTRKAVVADSLKSKRVLVKAFYCWKNWTQYAKIIRLRFQSMCKEYHRHKLVKQSFHHWKIRLMNRQADECYRNGLQMKIFKLWFLRYKRKVIHRHLCKALAKKGKKRRFFNKWSNFTKQQIERRRAFVGSLERMLVSSMLNNWRQHVKEKKALRSKELQLIQKKNHIASRKMVDRWLFAMQVANFRKKARVNWSIRCTRKACEAWKLLLKKKYLEQRLMVNRDIWQLVMMKRIFRTWKQQKRKVDTENEKVFRARAILTKNYKARVLQAWRVVNQEQQIISPMVARRERKELARVFDAWRLHIHRQKNIVDQKTRATEKRLDKYFLFWRDRAYLRVKEREVNETVLRNKISRAFTAWRGYLKDQRYAKLKIRARRFELMEKFYSLWKEKVQHRAEEKVEETGKEPLASTLGSTLGSTVSDALTSSGYGASIRRGSGSVFTFGLALKERDDDTASLPGRIDGIDQLLRPESPIVRPVSPISILRDSRPMSPLPFNSSQTSLGPSPSPSPSPEHPLPSTPPIRLEDFSPVKSEDDTGIHSGSSVSDHEDCDRMSTASCTSYTGRSTQSDPRDREVMATETILHWRNLPLSLTFRTWLKFTRQRKLQKELLNYITNNKTMELMAKTLVKWRRELYTKVTARQHWLDSSRLKYLRIWHEYAVTKRIQEERKMLADDHCRLIRLKGGFQKWKKKSSAKKKLQELIGQWQKKAMVTEKDKGFTQVIQKKQNARFLRHTFTYWVQMTRKSQEAKRLYTERLLPKCFKAWHVLASTRVSNRKKVVLFGERRLLTMAFREWQTRFQAISRVDEFIEIKEADRLLEILRVWHNWASGMNTRRKQSRLFRRSVELKITREIFINWLTGAQQLQIAKRTHELHIMKCVFVGWRDVALERTRNKRAMQEFKKNVDANLLARSFRFWQQLLAHSELSRAHTQHRDHNALRECFEEWRSYTLEIRAEKFFVMAMQKKTRRLIHSWKSITEEAKVLNNRAMHLAEGSEKKMLRRMFDYWVQEAHKVQKAKSHASGKMMRRTFLGLHQYVQSRVEKRKILQELLQSKEEELVSNSFKTWRERFQRSMRNLEVLEEHLQKKESELLHYCLVGGVKYMLRCKAEKSYEKKLVHKCFSRWWFALYTKKGSEKLQEQQEEIANKRGGRTLSKMCFRAWFHDTKLEGGKRKKGEHIVEKHFMMWKKRIDLNSIATEMVDHRVFEKFWTKWRHQLIRKRVSEMMMKHEDKKQLSEIPVADGDRGYGGFATLDVQSVNLIKGGEFKQVRWKYANMTPGDCLFLPYSYWHQVRSYGSKRGGVSVLFSRLTEFDPFGCENAKLEYTPLSDVNMGEVMEEHEDVRRNISEKVLRIMDAGNKGYVTKQDIEALTVEQVKQIANEVDPDPANTEEYEFAIFDLNEVNPPSDIFSWSPMFFLPLNRVLIGVFLPRGGSVFDQALHDGRGKLTVDNLIARYEDFGGSAKVARELYDMLQPKNADFVSKEELRERLDHVLKLYLKKKDDDKSVEKSYVARETRTRKIFVERSMSSNPSKQSLKGGAESEINDEEDGSMDKAEEHFRIKTLDEIRQEKRRRLEKDDATGEERNGSPIDILGTASPVDSARRDQKSSSKQSSPAVQGTESEVIYQLSPEQTSLSSASSPSRTPKKLKQPSHHDGATSGVQVNRRRKTEEEEGEIVSDPSDSESRRGENRSRRYSLISNPDVDEKIEAAEPRDKDIKQEKRTDESSEEESSNDEESEEDTETAAATKRAQGGGKETAEVKKESSVSESESGSEESSSDDDDNDDGNEKIQEEVSKGEQKESKVKQQRETGVKKNAPKEVVLKKNNKEDESSSEEEDSSGGGNEEEESEEEESESESSEESEQEEVKKQVTEKTETMKTEEVETEDLHKELQQLKRQRPSDERQRHKLKTERRRYEERERRGKGQGSSGGRSDKERFREKENSQARYQVVEESRHSQSKNKKRSYERGRSDQVAVDPKQKESRDKHRSYSKDSSKPKSERPHAREKQSEISVERKKDRSRKDSEKRIKPSAEESSNRETKGKDRKNHSGSKRSSSALEKTNKESRDSEEDTQQNKPKKEEGKSLILTDRERRQFTNEVVDIESEGSSAEDNKEGAPSDVEMKLSGGEQEEDEEEEKVKLPPYYPAVRGCRNVEEFQWLNRIEEGTYGVVYRAKDKRTGDIVALKKLKGGREKEGFPITSLREINRGGKAQHPNIVTVREIVVGSNMDKIYIVMDYVEHDLKVLMEHMTQGFRMGEIKTLRGGLLRAVAHLHDNWILHRDLKASNLLLSNKGILKVGDFGLAREYGWGGKNYTPIVVTLWYRAPELLLGTKMTFTDWGGNNLRNKFGAYLTDKGGGVLNRGGTYDPGKRITAEEALKHAYFSESPQPVDPSMFPRGGAKSEMAKRPKRKDIEHSPQAPEGGAMFAKLADEGDSGSGSLGFRMPTSKKGSAAVAGFTLKF